LPLLLAPQADNMAASKKQTESETKFLVRSIDRVLSRKCRPEVPERLQKESGLVEALLLPWGRGRSLTIVSAAGRAGRVRLLTAP
jgi:hypothetical protein